MLMLGSMVPAGCVVGMAEGALDAVGLVWGMVSALLVHAVNSARLNRVIASRIRILFNAVRLLAAIVTRCFRTYGGKILINEPQGGKEAFQRTRTARLRLAAPFSTGASHSASGRLSTQGYRNSAQLSPQPLMPL